MTLYQYAMIAEDACIKAPRINWAHDNEITKLRQHYDMNATEPVTEANLKQPVALDDDTIPLDALRDFIT